VGNRDLGAARDYHDRTKHSYASIGASPHVLDFSNQPLPFKIYTTLEPIALPRELPPIPAAALDAIAAGGEPVADAAGAGAALVPDLVTLTQILYYSAGLTKRRAYPGGEIHFRAAACTGALYHVDLYVVCGDLPGLEAGVYHFGPHDRGLRRLRAGDHRAILSDATAAEPAVASAAAVIVCTSTYWRNAWKYRERTYRHCFWDSGTLLANLLAVAAARRVPARVVAGFVDAAVNRLLDIDPAREAALALVPLGRAPERAPAAPPEVPPLGLETVPLSRREVDYPAIRRMHEASSLVTPEEVAAWRAGPPLMAAPAPAGRTVPLRPLPREGAAADPIDRTVLRRASARRFVREPLDFTRFSTILDRATRGVPADYLDPPGTTLNALYVIVNAVEELPPGAYAFDRGRAALVLLKEGDFRREAGYLGLGQELPAEASADVFLLANLAPIRERFGNRGYRAAELEAGVVSGKLYLAAYAQRLGATGLTFFDDDVTDFFSPPAAQESVMLLVALGRSAARGRMPV
jgi:SagB-type dehydrogenase family enzyme